MEYPLRVALLYIIGIITVFVLIGIIIFFWSRTLKRKIALRTQYLESEIARRKKVEEALRESEIHFRTLANSGQALVWTAGINKKCDYFNKTWLAFTGRTLTQELGDGWTQGVHPDDLERCLETYTGSFDRQEKFSMIYRLRRHDGEYRWLQDDGTPRFNSKEEFIGYIGYCLDVTELLQMEEDIKESEKRFRAAFYTSPDSININRLEDGLYVDINEGFTRLTGFTREDVIDKTSSEIQIWNNPADRQELVRGLKEKGYYENLEAEFRRKDGSTTTALMSARIIKLKGELHILSNTRDISDRKQVEKRLLESEEKYRLLVENSSEMIFIAQDGMLKFVNRAFLELMRYPADKLLSVPFVEFIHQEDRELVLSSHFRRLNGEALPSVYSFRIVTEEGTIRWAELKTTLTSWEGKLATLNFLADITERKKMEEHIRQTQKMEAIGTLAGGIAHDFNNILGAIMGYAAMAQDDLPAGSSARECVDEICEAGERAKFLVTQILAFSRHAETNVEPLMIGPIIQEVVRLLRHALPATIQVKQSINVKNTLILADATHIHQILMNLCTNAGHAMREHGGTLTVSLNQVEITDNNLPGHESKAAGSYLELKVTDTGHGIDPAVINRIFDPFFTTKKQGEGTGMGLAVVYGIVQGYGGYIDVVSQVNAGTTVTIYFCVPPEQIILNKEKSMRVSFPGRERIMIVEDQSYLLNMLRRMLSRLGYAVTAQLNPLEALALFTADPSAWDMIITDQTMPDLTGFAMAQKMLSARPDIPIILCTGFSDLVSAEEAKAMGIREFLLKPIAINDLTQTMRKIFDDNKGE